ncbi:SPASM domain-containing protein [Candidatus Woesearchaeota archaeon]|nr:SPASM domain-containing protein [Candidatus Woesearchaeota archaeon]MBT6225057.1 SPASM domain-containing protein [Candidatus Scalindua sp.]MBT6936894.1 SPASM domain-containing protein [Candidatus Neomarinimicrobiota bacterium]MBT6565138.1 SPASM domain-containing protein [Candidatus Scalindua sp.]MBT7211534.1 SPASM domain-containing protein [Candidatus Scalindua sp.]
MNLKHYPYSSGNRQILGENQCHHPLHHLVIKVSGDCVFCCYDYNGEQNIGNINDSNLLEIWERVSASRLRHELKNNIFNNLTLCKRCPGWQQYYEKR